jgi:hypothetical protein
LRRGAFQHSGGCRSSSTARNSQRWSVKPAAIAEVRAAHCHRNPAGAAAQRLAVDGDGLPTFVLAAQRIAAQGHLDGGDIQAAEGQFLRCLQAADEAAHAVVAAGEVVLGEQVLIDALGAEPQLQLGLDDHTPGEAVTGPAGAGLSREWGGRHVGKAGHADGRIGRFWSGRLPQVACDGLAVDAEFAGDAALGPAALMEGQDGIDHGHMKQIRHGRFPERRAVRESLRGQSASPQSGRF